MRKFYLLVLTFFLLSAGGISGSISLKDIEPLIVDCPKCNEEYKSCTDTAGKAYTTAIQNAADSLRSKTSKIDYRAACEEARRIKNKAIAECTEVYNKCCLAETKAEMEKNGKEKEEQ